MFDPLYFLVPPCNSGVRDAWDTGPWFNNGSGGRLKPEPLFASSLAGGGKRRQGVLSRQAFLIKRF
jgi:hypothetical protein